ncbi:FATTY ACID DESATURASE B, fatty acid desaturase 5 [Hibiscus trionum]|uniref:FATTY ACID DESATURASE B, fatty acid desaturase 5 n=1 Tax=Hibiscus trionum TaxID=183268 RepID=A0A9W7M8Z8_HIBTR|nr:FATTY ACID DESATURASE B, fatty acid desaturase 5 [Hibiscus trionum]
MALSAHIFLSLPFSVLARMSAPMRTRPSPCKVLNFGFNQAQKKQTSLHSSFVTRSRWEESAKEAEQEEKIRGGRIWLSDVVVRNRREVFWGRKWNALDITHAAAILSTHLLALCAPFYFTWPAFWVAFGLSVVSGLGITLSYHKNLCHRSFKLLKWLEYLFAYCGVQALEGSPIFWVSTHRCHHKFTDTERDPHSPIQGFWFSHIGWAFDTKTVSEKCGSPSNVGDLEKQPFYRFLHSTYFLHPIATGVVLYALGGFPFLVWGMGARIVYVNHAAFLVNSVSHVWGKQAWNTGDLSRNNWWLALITLGEGWHNNHHAFEYSARHGLEWWQFDPTWYVIRFLQIVGLATDVKLPSEDHKQKMAFNN